MQNTNSNYRNFSLNELKQLVQSKVPTPVNMVLDSTAVEFLLSLNTNNRDINMIRVKELCQSFHRIGWKCSESLCVTANYELGNGQHRLTALQKMDYTVPACATVVFGVDKATVLTIDQHQRRTASAAIKIRTGKKYSDTALAVIRLATLCDSFPGKMNFSSNSRNVSPEEINSQLQRWEGWFKEIPLLFSVRKIGNKKVQLSSAMALAVLHYAFRAGVNHANDFLAGFFGDKPVLSNSPEAKALSFHVTNSGLRGRSLQTHQYRVFVHYIIAHFERTLNPKTKEAMSWGKLSTEDEAKARSK